MMSVAEIGDHVAIHYEVCREDGSATSSRGPNRSPLHVTVGVKHPRLPGLGEALAGLAPGDRLSVHVPAEGAYGRPNPARVHRWARTRFSDRVTLNVGKWLRLTDRQGRRRWVRIEAVSDRDVVFNANRRWAGQAVRLEIEVLTVEPRDPRRGPARHAAAEPPEAAPPTGRVIGFDLDRASLNSLRAALPGWRIDAVLGGSADTFPCGWDPGAADLLIVSAGADPAATWALCHFIASGMTRPDSSRREAAVIPARRWRLGDEAPPTPIPLLVLMPLGQSHLIREAVDAGARHCLVLPITPEGVAGVMAGLQAPPRSALHLYAAPDGENRWRDDGGRG